MTKLSYSLDEVCQLTGVGKTKIYQLINAGDINARKLGKRTIVLKDDLENFLNNLSSYNSEVGAA